MTSTQTALEMLEIASGAYLSGRLDATTMRNLFVVLPDLGSAHLGENAAAALELITTRILDGAALAME